MVARFHTDCVSGSISATDTLNAARSLSFTERTTCRLSFSDCACSIRISRVSDAMGKETSVSRRSRHRVAHRRHRHDLAAYDHCADLARVADALERVSIEQYEVRYFPALDCTKVCRF